MDLIKTLGLKCDDKLPMHYFIGIAINSNFHSTDRGKLYMKYGPLFFTNADIINLKFAIETSKTELPKTKLKDSMNLFDVSELVSSLSGMLVACRANNCTVHHFSSDTVYTEDIFIDLIEQANTSKYSYELLMKSEVRA